MYLDSNSAIRKDYSTIRRIPRSKPPAPHRRQETIDSSTAPPPWEAPYRRRAPPPTSVARRPRRTPTSVAPPPEDPDLCRVPPPEARRGTLPTTIASRRLSPTRVAAVAGPLLRALPPPDLV